MDVSSSCELCTKIRSGFLHIVQSRCLTASTVSELGSMNAELSCVMERARASTHASLLRRPPRNFAKSDRYLSKSFQVLSYLWLQLLHLGHDSSLLHQIVSDLSRPQQQIASISTSRQKDQHRNGTTPARMLNHVLHIKVKLAEVSAQPG